MVKCNALLFKNKRILITGGTGSLGQSLTKKLLELDVDTIRILSRNESKQVDMDEEFNDKRLRFLIGDIRDKERLIKSFEGIDIVFHAAALKHVPVIEYNPFEAIKTNVIGSQTIIDAAVAQDVKKVICIGTDKSVSPLNTYGATKLLMEKLFVSSNFYLNKKKHKTKFIALRYGNVLGSSGSVVPKFIQQIRSKQKITITDPNMTRFSLTMKEALDFILESAYLGNGSEVFVPKIKSYSLTDLKETIKELLGNVGDKNISLRPGEKLHEVLINGDEIRQTWEYNDMYLVSNPLYATFHGKEISDNYENITELTNLENYSSAFSEKISKNELEIMIKNSGLVD